MIDGPELLELLAGERCPCGHLVDEHELVRSGRRPVAGTSLVERCGPCSECECRGLLEIDE